jgi:hypothetical protein
MAEDAPATLNLAVDAMSWELFQERFQKRCPSEEFIERYLNKFDSLRGGGHTILEYEA